MIPIYLAMGSNLEPRETYLCQAITQLKTLGKVKKIASLYEAEPYGVIEQPQFLNTAVLLETDLSPLDLLKTLKSIEYKLGRRTRYRWGPREIDIDIIFYGEKIIHEKELHIPHYDYQNRRFVLQPLMDLEPQLMTPDTHKSLSQVYRDCSDNSRLKLRKKVWVVNGT